MVKTKICEAESGFRARYSSVDNLFVLRIQHLHEKRQILEETDLAFVDLIKAHNCS
jgi:hypothetical protein